MSRKKYDETFKKQIILEYEVGGISCYALGQNIMSQLSIQKFDVFIMN